jgi:hypothetical protein
MDCPACGGHISEILCEILLEGVNAFVPIGVTRLGHAWILSDPLALVTSSERFRQREERRLRSAQACRHTYVDLLTTSSGVR